MYDPNLLDLLQRGWEVKEHHRLKAGSACTLLIATNSSGQEVGIEYRCTHRDLSMPGVAARLRSTALCALHKACLRVLP